MCHPVLLVLPHLQSNSQNCMNESENPGQVASLHGEEIDAFCVKPGQQRVELAAFNVETE